MSEINYASLAADVHKNAVEHGFWDGEAGDTPLKWALVHAEISEVLEAERDGLGPFFVTADGKPEGVAVELADVAIRCLDILGEWQKRDDASVHNLADSIASDGLEDTSIGGSLICVMHAVIVPIELSLEEGAWLLITICEQVVTEQFPDVSWLGVLAAKMAYNKTRPRLHGKKF